MTLVWESGITLQHPDNNDPLLDLNTQPSLDLQFATSKTLDDAVSGTNLITFSRASSGTYVDSDGLIKSATTDAPRFDHDPVTGESLGLLVEEERTNYATQSANPSTWTTTNGATKETFAAVTAPDGSTITQGFRIPDGGSRVYPTLSSPGTVEPVGSVYARAVSGTATLSLFIQGVDVQTNVTVPSDSWVRLNGTKASATTTAFSVRGNAIQSEDVYLWGAQLEIASFPTSYIPTSGSTVTRAADVASITGTNFSSWYNQSEGTYFVGLPRPARETAARAFNANVQLWSEPTRVTPVRTGSSTNYVNVSYPAKTAVIYNDTECIGAGNGVLSANVGGTNAAASLLAFGYSATAGVGYLNGHISRLAYFPYRLADATLQEITS
jgi:hypothetical protein